MSNIISVPSDKAKEITSLQLRIEGYSVDDDNSAVVMGRMLRDIVTVTAEVKELFTDEVSDANKKHKALTNERSGATKNGDDGEAVGRLKLEQWATEQYRLASEASENGEVLVKLFPDINGVSFTPVIMPAVINHIDFVLWAVDTGNHHLLKIDSAKLKKLVNAGGPQRTIPGVVTKTEYSVTVRKN